MKKFIAKIYEADDTFFEGELESIVLNTVDGEYGVLADHENLVVAVVPGKMVIRTPDGKSRDCFVSDGMMRIEDGEVLILVDSAEYAEEIDIARAKAKEEKARQIMIARKSEHEYALAESSLKRAVARIKIKNGGGFGV